MLNMVAEQICHRDKVRRLKNSGWPSGCDMVYMVTEGLPLSNNYDDDNNKAIINQSIGWGGGHGMTKFDNS